MKLRNAASEEAQRHFGSFSADGDLVASVSAAPLDSTRVKIRKMAVASNQRGRGCGRALLLAAEEALRREGFRHVLLHARLEVSGFYESLHYERVGRDFMELGILHVEMRKDL